MGTLEQEDLTQGKRIFSDMILYIEDPKDATRKLLELINKFGKATGYKINTQKSVAFLYITMKDQKESQEAIPFTTTSKRIKYLGINLPKEEKTCSSVFAWRIPGTGEPGGLPSMGSPESDTTEAT